MFVALQIVAMTLISAGSAGEIVARPLLLRRSRPNLRGSTERALNVSPTNAAHGQFLHGVESGLAAHGGRKPVFADGRFSADHAGRRKSGALCDRRHGAAADIVHVLSGTPDVLKLYAAPIWSTGTHVAKAGK